MFGCGFREQTIITLTTEVNEPNGACLLPASGQFRVLTENLEEYTALVDIVAPIAFATPYYFCIKNAEDALDEKVSAIQIFFKYCCVRF